MTDPTPTPAALPDELARLLNAASALVQRSAHIGGHVVTEPGDLDALREALAPARRAAEGLAGRAAGWETAWRQADAALSPTWERAERLRAELVAGQTREAALALLVERLASFLRDEVMPRYAELFMFAFQGDNAEASVLFQQARELLALALAPDPMPAALLAAARAVLAETAAREGLRLALRHEAPAGGLAPAMEAHERAEKALSRAAAAMRAAGWEGE